MRRVGSLGHILQVCPRTHASRVARHNKVVKVVASNARKKGWSVLVEPAIPTPAGVCSPDLVIHGLRKTAFVIDATIVADNADLTERHKGKRQYYDSPAICQWVKGVTMCDTELAVQRAETLCRDIGMSTSFLSLISQVVLEKGLRIYQHYGRSTFTQLASWSALTVCGLINLERGLGPMRHKLSR